jgi:hypothetical protein
MALGDEAPTYERDIRPLLSKHCTICHSKKNLANADVSAGLALDSYEAVLAGPSAAWCGAGSTRAHRVGSRRPRPARPPRRIPQDAVRGGSCGVLTS